MKNKYELIDDCCFIYLQNGQKSIIDKDDFGIADSIDGTWCALYNEHTKSYYCIHVRTRKHKTEQIRLHRLLIGATKRKDVIDHVDHNTLNNRRSNLCMTSLNRNMQNQIKAHADNKTGYLGVIKIGKVGKYQANISVGGKDMYLGRYESAQEAHDAYVCAKANYHNPSGLKFMKEGGY